MLVICSTRSGAERPGKFPEFSRGYIAYEKNWEVTANQMFKSLKRWHEDGKEARVDGNLEIPYLPRFYLGDALYVLTCYEVALSHLEESILDTQAVEDAEEERKKFIIIKQACQQKLYKGIKQEDPEINCTYWILDQEPTTTDSSGETEKEQPRRHRGNVERISDAKYE